MRVLCGMGKGKEIEEFGLLGREDDPLHLNLDSSVAGSEVLFM